MKRVVVRKDVYVDSVFLMLMSKDMQARAEVETATVAMGTPMNIQLLIDQGFPKHDVSVAKPTDLLVAIDCPNAQDLDEIEAFAFTLLENKHHPEASGETAIQPKTIGSACKDYGDSNIALISLPGIYAASEAKKALQHNLHVMLFSDNVSLEDEIALKRLAWDKGLLMMGPDCGTAMIAGKPLCFANVVKKGGVGIVAASGTGLQEVACLLDRFGAGVSHAIGTGGRDLKNPAVGGLTMRMGISAMGADDGTSVIAIVSKPPAKEVVDDVLETLRNTGKPAVVHFIGANEGDFSLGPTIRWAHDLEETARIAATLAGSPVPPREYHDRWPFDMDHRTIDALVARELEGMQSGQRYIRGYYTGGTLADETWLALHGPTGGVWSNNHTDPAFVPKDPHTSVEHTIVDLGDDVFTVGRPHPMIDPSTRTERIESEIADGTIAVMLVDCVLGYGSHENPAGAMVPSLVAAKEAARKRGGYLSVIASVTGTTKDPQIYERQRAILEDAGVVVMPSNHQATMLALRLLVEKHGWTMPENQLLKPVANKTMRKGPVKGKTVPVPDTAQVLALFANGPVALNLGLESFSLNLESCGAQSVHLAWRPPAGGDIEVIDALDALSESSKFDVDAANTEAVGRLLKGKPILQGIGIARDVVPGMRENLVLHAGPPVTWERMCGPMRGAVIGALIYEGKAKNPQEAQQLAASGTIDFEPCHHHAAVGPMAGIMTASMPVWIIQNETFGNYAFATLNEGLGKVLRYGAYSEEVLDRLHWMADELAPILHKAIQRHGPIDMRGIIVQALQMGDEGHNRNRAGTSLMIRELAPHLVMLGEAPQAISRVFSFMHANDHFFLNLSMPSAKCVLDPASGVPGSTMITTMARNGTDFGIRISGMPDRWFTGPAGMVDGLYLPGFSAGDSAPDIGDSVITETSGIGGFAMAAAPAIVKFVGGSPADAITFTKRMYGITLAEHNEYRIPALDFRGTPTGIDVRLVVESGVLPVINTGIAHKDPGVGMVGAGLVKPPENCFRDAVLACAKEFV